MDAMLPFTDLVLPFPAAMYLFMSAILLLRFMLPVRHQSLTLYTSVSFFLFLFLLFIRQSKTRGSSQGGADPAGFDTRRAAELHAPRPPQGRRRRAAPPPGPPPLVPHYCPF
eukprot:182895-Rhodomonas_salina.3